MTLPLHEPVPYPRTAPAAPAATQVTDGMLNDDPPRTTMRIRPLPGPTRVEQMLPLLLRRMRRNGRLPTTVAAEAAWPEEKK